MSLKRRLLPAALLVPFTGVVVALGTNLPSTAATTDDKITSYVAVASLNGDGVLKVKETVELTAGGDTVRRTLQTRVRSDADQYRVYDIRNVSATVNGKPAAGFENSAVDSGRELSLRASGQVKIVYS